MAKILQVLLFSEILVSDINSAIVCIKACTKSLLIDNSGPKFKNAVLQIKQELICTYQLRCCSHFARGIENLKVTDHFGFMDEKLGRENLFITQSRRSVIPPV